MDTSPTPLAARLRPKKLENFVGQEKLVGENGFIRRMLDSGKLSSMIFWGPPGTGKTTLAEIVAKQSGAEFLKLSAVTDGKEALKKVLGVAEQNYAYNKQTILFVDEIHRWNKAQQDALLPYVESGQVTLIGATTENPSFSVISPLLSRSRVVVFEQHSDMDVKSVIKKGVASLGAEIEPEALELLVHSANGDMRNAINNLELASTVSLDNKKITLEDVQTSVQKFLRYDKTGEEHYNLISAVHKSMRSSDASAAAYWVMRMLSAGEDPLYLARRMVRFASEDIGAANPNALLLANVVYDTCYKIGMPECEVALVQLAQYLANAPKDNSAYTATVRIKQDIEQYGNLEVPLHLRNAPTQLMKDIGYGEGYKYDHDSPGKKSGQQCLPDSLRDRDYFA